MNSILPFCIVLISVVFNCDAACYLKMVKWENGQCNVDGKQVELGQSYEENCVGCTCSMFGRMSCCSMGHHITQHPPECKIIQDGCTEKAVSITDESMPCLGPIAAVGK